MKRIGCIALLALPFLASAQVRIDPQAPTPAALNRLRVDDPQIAQLRSQLAALKQQVDALAQRDQQLGSCVAALRHEVDALKHPKPANDNGVTVQPSKGLGALLGCD